MNNMQVLGKFLDQPLLVSKFEKKVPLLLSAGAAMFVAKDVYESKPEEKKKTAIRDGITMAATVVAALSAPKIASFIAKRPLPPNLDKIKEINKKSVNSFLEKHNVSETSKKLLEKSKENVLRFNEVKTLFNDLSKDNDGAKFLMELIPDPVNISAKDIFSEIGYLSVYGLIPVAGGIAGGIAADNITDKKNWKKKIPDKIKEGSYQYLANIFMCNVGAGAALGILEKAGIQSKGARAAGMIAGIIATGIIGGSKIANFIGKKVIDPVCGKFMKKEDKSSPYSNIRTFRCSQKNIFSEDFFEIQNKTYGEKEKYKERTPEMLDIGLHTDDIATVSLLSGLKWIEPGLPVLYTVSGYRAGTGYRN